MGREKVLIERPLWPNVVQYFVTGLPRIAGCQEGYRLRYKLSTVLISVSSTNGQTTIQRHTVSVIGLISTSSSLS